MTIYGTVGQVIKTAQPSAIGQLTRIRQHVCLSATGAMSTTPNAAMERLLKLLIQEETRSVIHLYANYIALTTLYQQVKKDKNLGMPYLLIQPHQQIKKDNFQIQTTARESWKQGPPSKSTVLLDELITIQNCSREIINQQVSCTTIVNYCSDSQANYKDNSLLTNQNMTSKIRSGKPTRDK